MKEAKVLAFIVLSIILASSASALSFVSFSGNSTPAQIYETTNADFAFQVSNGLFSLNSIDNVSIGATGFSLVNMIDIVGWDEIGFVAYHTTTNAISNWGSQNFGFTAKANQVSQDSTYNWPVIVTDTAGDSSYFTYQITVLDDATPPVMTNPVPTPNSFIQGTSSQMFSIDAVDPETGVASANAYRSINCTGNYTSNALSASGNTWSANLDLSADPEALSICYYFDSTNNGGASGTTPTYNMVVDRTPPTVILNSPANGVLLNSSNVTLDFNATDNLATSLSCSLVIDSAANSMNVYGQTLYNAVLADGQHSWSVACTDGAGWTTASAVNTFTVDTQGPNITINPIQTAFRGNPAQLDANIVDAGVGLSPSTVQFTVTDPASNPSAVSITQNGNIFSGNYATTISSLLGSYSLLVSAIDNIGNAAAAVSNFIITYSYLLGLTSTGQVNPSDPANNITNNITISGNVTYDNGSSVPETSLILTVPDSAGNYTNVTAGISNDQFTYAIASPQVSGSYVITAIITPSNGYTFTKSSNVYVGLFCGDNSCNNGESCSSCASDCGSCPPSPSGGSGGNGGSSRRSSSGGGQVVNYQPEEPNTNDDGLNGIVEQPKEEQKDDGKNSEPVPVAQITGAAVAPLPENPGVGAGIGLFSNLKIKWWVIALIAGLLVTLYAFGKVKKRKDNRFNREMSEYLERRYKEP